MPIRQLFSENRVKLILLLGFLLLFVIFLPTLMFSNVPNIVTLHASEGYLDLSGYAIIGEQEQRGTIFRLEGEWEYYPNQLLSSKDFSDGINSTVQYADYPHGWQTDPENFPDYTGTATYRMICHKPNNLTSLGIYSRFQFGAYKIFVNGFDILNIGVVSDDPSQYHVSYRSGDSYICPLDGDTFEIILQIQNYDHILAGFSGPIFIGDMTKVRFFAEFLMLINGIMIGFLLVLLLYFLIVFIQDRSKPLYLNFAVVTLMSLYISMTTCNESIAYTIVPIVSPHIIFKLEYITQIVAALFSTNYIAKKYMKNSYYAPIAAALCIVISAAITLTPSMGVSRLRISFQVIGTSFYIAPIFLTFREMLLRRSKTASWEFVSLLMLVGGIAFTKMGIVLWNCVDLFPIMVTLYCFIQVVVLTYYYSGIEEDLIKLNQTLEIRIEERTRDLIDLTKRAEAATVAKSDFLAQMSHEIRTPMNAIIGMSDLIQTDNLNDTQKLYFRDIKEVSHSLLNIINDILDFSKIESGKFQIAPVHFNFYSMIDNICSMFYYTAKSKDLGFESSVDTTIPPVLFGDETRIRQAVSNILSNAIKYTRKGYVKFTVERVNNNRDILFSVTDTGVGIKESDIPRLFQLFEQLDKGDSVKGTGLGLAICKQLTELMGGTVSVTSSYGSGSTFTIRLPLTEGDPALIETIEIKEKVYADHANILVVDDNAINITVAKGILATHNIKPDSAESGLEALEMVKNKDYDLIFMDHMMPEMDGIETMNAIRQLGGRHASLPIIALTANAVTGTREFLIKSGMTDFISKPINRAALNTILAKWLPSNLVDTQHHYDEPEEQDDGLLSVFMDVPGLTVQKGLTHVGGNVKTYLAVLNQFVYETPSYMRQLDPEAGDLPLYAVVVHGLKGSLHSIGAEWLGDWAFSLEKFAKAGDRNSCTAQTKRFLESVYSFIDMLTPLLQTITPEPAEEKSEATAEQLIDMLTPLKTACVLGDCTTIDSIANGLKKLTFGEFYDLAVSEIVSLTEYMDYGEAAEKIEAFIEMMNNL